MSRTIESVTVDEMYASAKRELGMRERKYPQWVAAGRLSPRLAERELLFQQAIVAYLEARLGPPAQKDMFS